MLPAGTTLRLLQEPRAFEGQGSSFGGCLGDGVIVLRPFRGAFRQLDLQVSDGPAAQANGNALHSFLRGELPSDAFIGSARMPS